VTYESLAGHEVVGSLKRVPRARWAVVSEVPADAAYWQVRRFRNLTLLVVAGLLLGVGAVLTAALFLAMAFAGVPLWAAGAVAGFIGGGAQPLLFKNIRVFFLGSDDFPSEAKADAARDLNAALEAKWPGFEDIHHFALPGIAEAHEYVESRKACGRAVVTPS